MDTCGKRIRQARKKLGLTQREVAAATGTTAASISFWENDVHQPKGRYLIKLAKKLNNKPEYFVGVKAYNETVLDIQAEKIREAFLKASPELQDAACRLFGTVQQNDSERQAEK